MEFVPLFGAQVGLLVPMLCGYIIRSLFWCRLPRLNLLEFGHPSIDHVVRVKNVKDRQNVPDQLHKTSEDCSSKSIEQAWIAQPHYVVNHPRSVRQEKERELAINRIDFLIEIALSQFCYVNAQE